MIDTYKIVSYTAVNKKSSYQEIFLPALTCVIENENGLEVRLHVHTDFFAKDILLKIKQKS